MLSVTALTRSCLGKIAPLSVIRDVHGVYKSGFPTSTFPLSLREQLTLVSSAPFVRVAIFHVWPVGAPQTITPIAHIDIRDANAVLLSHCGIWIYVTSVSPIYTDRFGPDVTIELGTDGLGRDEEDLFALGRDPRADIIGYYVGAASVGGRGSHSRRRFWVKKSQQFRGYALAHELGHAIADLRHVGGGPTSNLMCLGANCLWADGPTLTEAQCQKLAADPVVRRCGDLAGARTLDQLPEFTCGNDGD